MRPLFSFIPRPIRVAVFLAAVTVILYLTLAPNQDVPGSGMIWDKAAHSIAYGLLTLVGLFMSTHRRWMVVAAVWSLGIGVEIAQGLMGFGRQGDWRDALANTIGIVLAYVLWAIARRFKPR
ncbi:MAG: VanZ family protein [Phenylobacterium sp.]|uniref:VanZ family protein n=1 Tax=Phenylobacterium sp. TaxID=1871053 RepID=UPI00271A19A1|nr:VanZ family protein [Phenylobacterium sp.]MDO9432480.1 VanZ family protein [Phenylobacterium sp.]